MVILLEIDAGCSSCQVRLQGEGKTPTMAWTKFKKSIMILTYVAQFDLWQILFTVHLMLCVWACQCASLLLLHFSQIHTVLNSDGETF